MGARDDFFLEIDWLLTRRRDRESGQHLGIPLKYLEIPEPTIEGDS